MRKESDFSTPLLDTLPEDDRGGGGFKTARCMGIGTGGVVCRERALSGSLYCKHCDPLKKLDEKRKVYSQMWGKLLPMPKDLQPELVGRTNHAELAEIWLKVLGENPPKICTTDDKVDLWRRKEYLDRAIDWARDNEPDRWEDIESIEEEIKDLEETVQADSLVELLRVSSDQLANPIYPPLPHEVAQPKRAKGRTRVYKCHAPE